MKTLSLIDSLRPYSLGFDDMFRHFEDFFNKDLDAFDTNKCSYNIIKLRGNSYDIEIALPGHEKNDVEVSIEGNLLKIQSTCKDQTENKDKKYLHKGVEKEKISVSFFIGNNVKVKDAIMESGLLTVKCVVDKPAGNNVIKIPVTTRQ
jgi:molecular chaperone IbpA